MKLVKHLLLVILAILKHDFRASGQEPSCEDTKGVLLTERIIRLENDLKRSNELFESLVGKLNGSVTLLGNSPVPYLVPPLTVAELEVNGWTMIFRATAGNGDKVLDAWMSGSKTTSQKPLTMERSLDAHYRDKGIDTWTHHNIRYLKLALYKERREVAYVIFDAAGSSKSNWFAGPRVLSSSWPDLTAQSPYNYFSIEVFANYNRRFYINRQHGGCDNDLGHVAVSEMPVKRCDWDTYPAYPQFLYSATSSVNRWNRLQYGQADYLAIFAYK